MGQRGKNPHIFTPHMHALAGGYVIGALVSICWYVCGPKKILNRTLAIGSPFQSFTVGLIIIFID